MELATVKCLETLASSPGFFAADGSPRPALINSCTPTCFGFSGMTVDGHGIEPSRQVLVREVIQTRFGRLGSPLTLSVESFVLSTNHTTIWFQHVPTLNSCSLPQGIALGHSSSLPVKPWNWVSFYVSATKHQQSDCLGERAPLLVK